MLSKQPSYAANDSCQQTLGSSQILIQCNKSGLISLETTINNCKIDFEVSYIYFLYFLNIVT